MSVGGVAVSVVLHVGVFVVLTRTQSPPKIKQKTAIRVVQKQPDPEDKPPPPKPEPIKANLPEARAPEQPPPPKNEPVKPKPKAKEGPENDGGDAKPQTNAPALDLSDMAFTNPGGSGPAVNPDSVGRDPNTQQPAAKPKPRAVEKKVADKMTATEGGPCAEELVKPKAVNKVPIDYPTAAREAGVEGQLVLRAHVGADGKVGEIEVVKSAGALIDEPAVAALKNWTFEPATKCGKPVESTFTISRRFELGT